MFVTIISPAKKLDYSPVEKNLDSTIPSLLEHSNELIKDLKSLNPQEVSSLMSLSDKLGALNYERFQEWKTPFTKSNSKQAILAFKGDVYQGLDAESLSETELIWAQKHVRILSGLYGILKPMDLMQPYRLEMGTKFATKRGQNLYDFWNSIITEELNKNFSSDNTNLLNLASNEYFKSINVSELKANVISPVFMDKKNGKYKIISFFAKKARGLMTRYVIKNRIEDITDIQNFEEGGYFFNEEMSEDNKPVFCRD
tara:strand:- start:468 stop:1235 length:768 start_codon:yes stop_codon:yes gene_type:complete